MKVLTVHRNLHKYRCWWGSSVKLWGSSPLSAPNGTIPADRTIDLQNIGIDWKNLSQLGLLWSGVQLLFINSWSVQNYPPMAVKMWCWQELCLPLIWCRPRNLGTYEQALQRDLLVPYALNWKHDWLDIGQVEHGLTAYHEKGVADQNTNLFFAWFPMQTIHNGGCESWVGRD